jgi:hypothetical protein
VAPQQPTNICHTSDVNWSTFLPPVTVHLPRHCPVTSAADVIRATCHPYSGDMCHPWIGPVVRQINLPRSATCCHLRLPHVVSRRCHVSPSGAATSTCTDYTVIPIFFAYLAFRTERDIFLTRSPFDEENIPTESGRRDGRNGVGFITFRALSFLIIFKPCQASGSDFGSFQNKNKIIKKRIIYHLFDFVKTQN